MGTALVPTPARQAHATAADTRAGKYLTFHLDSEEFAIQVLKVREIMGVQEITAVPQTPVYVKGVINLRGRVIPIIDLRMKFALPQAEYTQRTCIVVVDVHSEVGRMLMGVVVDGVTEVLNLSPTEIEDTPEFGNGIVMPHILGLAKTKGKVKILLDIDRVLSSQDIIRLDEALG
jgi:purine-binding chemotaxis protein CheW